MKTLKAHLLPLNLIVIVLALLAEHIYIQSNDEAWVLAMVGFAITSIALSIKIILLGR